MNAQTALLIEAYDKKILELTRPGVRSSYADEVTGAEE